MASNNRQMNALYGRPKSFTPVQVQDRLPWVPRRTDGRVQAVLVHPLLAEEFVAACHDAAKACPGWVPQRIDSYVPRAIRNYFKGNPPAGWKLGDKGTSNHSWATAFDFFATPADVWPAGGVWTPDNGVPVEFAKAFERRGWTWGGRWKRRDTPHMEYTVKPPPPGTAGKIGDPGYVDWLSDMLKQGDTGTAVLDLQLGLLMAGVDGVTPSGQFGPDTTAAVRGLQSVAGVQVDGVVGPQTERVIAYLWAQEMPTVDDVVTRAYEVVLGREPAPNGRSYWSERVKSGQMNPSQLARHIWFEDEAIKLRSGAPPAPKPTPAPESGGYDTKKAAQELATVASDLARIAKRLGS